MNEQLGTVIDGLVVGLAYDLRLADGELIDQADDNEPLFYLHGAGEIIPGLEEALRGMAIGETKDVVIDAEDAYGEYDPDNVEIISLDDFPDDMELEEGLELELHTSEEDEVITAYVSSITDDEVVLDLNHPLAGESLHFHVRVVSLRQATPSEVEHGHVHHSHDHDHH